jgi:uncharacterized membrane protein YgdD (TMEM256/DUF423 family)
VAANPDLAAMTDRPTLPFRLAAALGFSGVALGAFGAHLLKPTLAAFGTADTWQTGVTYQLIHAVALLALAATGRAGWLVTWLWTGGVVVFSGTLYIIATSELKWLGVITPIGGVALLVGWLCLLIRGR